MSVEAPARVAAVGARGRSTRRPPPDSPPPAASPTASKGVSKGRARPARASAGAAATPHAPPGGPPPIDFVLVGAGGASCAAHYEGAPSPTLTVTTPSGEREVADVTPHELFRCAEAIFCAAASNLDRFDPACSAVTRVGPAAGAATDWLWSAVDALTAHWPVSKFVLRTVCLLIRRLGWDTACDLMINAALLGGAAVTAWSRYGHAAAALFADPVGFAAEHAAAMAPSSYLAANWGAARARCLLRDESAWTRVARAATAWATGADEFSPAAVGNPTLRQMAAAVARQHTDACAVRTELEAALFGWAVGRMLKHAFAAGALATVGAATKRLVCDQVYAALGRRSAADAPAPEPAVIRADTDEFESRLAADRALLVACTYVRNAALASLGLRPDGAHLHTKLDHFPLAVHSQLGRPDMPQPTNLPEFNAWLAALCDHPDVAAFLARIRLTQDHVLRYE